MYHFIHHFANTAHVFHIRTERTLISTHHFCQMYSMQSPWLHLKCQYMEKDA